MPEVPRKVTESRSSRQGACCEADSAVAKDEAFCFFIRDNLELLASLGAKIEYFRRFPMRSRQRIQTDFCSAAAATRSSRRRAFRKNQTMRTKIRDNIRQGMPVLAECGGYMYPVRIHGGYGWKCVSYGTGCSGKCLPDKSWEDSAISPLTPNTKDTFRNGGNPVRRP